ncbi:SH3 domain-containing protein [Streptomyces sp. NPDC057499]|uniref:SH3 domain-containing protein n=1 Tax=Streptomyces sp. NPDC057499 TaxID=3346150 RepID=UPI003691BC03
MTKKTTTLAAAVLTAALGLAVSPAAQAVQPPVAARSAQAPAAVCTVNDNGVNFRGGPGENFPVLGQVNRGQNLNYRGQQGNWIMGDLWGGPTGVWVHVAYLNC